MYGKGGKKGGGKSGMKSGGKSGMKSGGKSGMMFVDAAPGASGAAGKARGSKKVTKKTGGKKR